MIRSPSAVSREEDEEVKPYVVVAEIGKGSFATVYKGYHSVCPRPGCLAQFILTLSSGNAQPSRDKDRQQEQAYYKAIRESPE